MLSSQHRASMARCQGRRKRLVSIRSKVDTVSKSVTEQMFARLQQLSKENPQAGGAGGQTTYEALLNVDKMWQRIKDSSPSAASVPQFIAVADTALGTIEYDCVVAGGTLGIFLACALQVKGLRVAVIERGELKGRAQEWNISRKELAELLHVCDMDKVIDDVISVEFNPVRCGFFEGTEVWTRDVLNLGVSPERVVAAARAKFDSAGGVTLENTSIAGVRVHPNGCSIDTGEQAITGKLLVDCMGNGSPAARQLRGGARPDGICLVVGSCCRGFDPAANTTGDVIYTNTHVQSPDAAVQDVQYFWEAFPSGSGPTDRTTYMFTYMDAAQYRPSLQNLMEDYWRLMPQYQSINLESVAPLRILFGCFPTYRDSPLQPGFDRVLHVGDASGIQSPLSFGGFGAMSRHLERLSGGIQEALEADALGKEDLGLISAYNPGLSAAWMFQRAMSVRREERPAKEFVNRLLSNNFKAMERMGDEVLKPFLQDVVQFRGLTATLYNQVVSDIAFVGTIIGHVGIPPILDFCSHYAALGVSTVLAGPAEAALGVVEERLSPKQKFQARRRVEAIKYGAGLDYTL